MSRSVNIPYFAEPPVNYDRAYFAQMTRAFALYTQQMNTPGPWQASTLVLKIFQPPLQVYHPVPFGTIQGH